ncbi:MAG: TIGR01620 family protein [Pseudomonadota bacterium]|nr:TIGR01620 family protein [Pseudomonadota bacterium]
MSEGKRRGPVMIDLEDTRADTPEVNPAEAPPVPDAPGALSGPLPEGRAMQMAATLAGRRPSRLARWFWGLLATLVGAVRSGRRGESRWLGWVVTALIAAFGLVCLAIVVKEAAAFARLSRMDRLHHLAQEAATSGDLKQARDFAGKLEAIYRARPDLDWHRDRFAERRDEQFDAAALLALAEAELIAPLDAAALREVEAAARQVATVTALVPLAFADVVAAMTSNIRMIRRVAEVYGGRSGTLGSWRLMRAVMTHLVATGAVAVGDDMIGSVLGGNVLARLSRRFGEGVVNGALTARVGVAAMEVCRPMPFGEGRRPSVTGVLRRALTGLFGDKA